ncbi:MAG: SRPBCC domain-containing protein [Pseudomonadales bacterium]
MPERLQAARRAAASLTLLLGLLAAVEPAAGQVAAQAPEGFVVANELLLDGSPERVYQAITGEVASWWDGRHSWSGDAANFSMDPRAGGCFCERLPAGGSVEHMRVVFASPGHLLRLSGGLGPLQGMGVSGSMDFALAAADRPDQTRLAFRYVVSGYPAGGLDGMAEPVDSVLSGQLQRLAAYLRTGSPESR